MGTCAKSVAIAAALALVAGASAAALTTPGRSRVRLGPVLDVAVTHASIAYVVGATRRDCDHVELWNPDSRGTWRFGTPRPCGDTTSTGRGIADVAVANSRALWVAYVGGNIREWSLMTATITRKAPRRLRLVARDVDEPSPIVLGEGARDGIPFAVDSHVTYLGDDGTPIFRWTAPAAVRSLAAGNGPGGARVAVALASEDVVLLSGSGTLLATYSFAPGPVQAIRLAPTGLVAHVGREVQIRNGPALQSVPLPEGGRMLDYASGRVLYRVGATVRTVHVATGADAQLLPTGPGRTSSVSLDAHGLAWATGKAVNWACAVCIDFGD